MPVRRKNHPLAWNYEGWVEYRPRKHDYEGGDKKRGDWDWDEIPDSDRLEWEDDIEEGGWYYAPDRFDLDKYEPKIQKDHRRHLKMTMAQYYADDKRHGKLYEKNV